MLNSKILFVGGGRIVNIMLGGWKKKNKNLKNITVFDPETKVLENLQKEYDDIKTVNELTANINDKDIIFLAIHPPVVKEILGSLKGNISVNTIIISLAPKVTIENIINNLNGHNKIVRSIPNAASIINEGYNPLCFSNGLQDEEKQNIINDFSILGECPIVAENKLEAYAIVTAMGPTYFCPQINELHKLGLDFGLSEQDTIEGMVSMLTSTIKLLYQSELNYDKVTDLIPVKPLGDSEQEFREIYRSKLTGLYNKIKGN